MKGWKTVIVSAALAVVGIIEQTDAATLVPQEHVGAFVTGIAVLMAALRKFTTTPLGKSS